MKTDDTIEKLREFLNADENVCFAVVFGSYAQRKQKKRSDIDIAIFFRSVLEEMALMNLIDALSDLARKEIHLAVLNTASAFLRHQVMKSGIPLIINDRLAYVRFRERTMSDFEEYKFVSGMNAYVR